MPASEERLARILLGPAGSNVVESRSMPIYEYACGCGKRFEELVLRASDEAEVACRACGSREVKRQLSRPADSPSASRGTRGCGPVG